MAFTVELNLIALAMTLLMTSGIRPLGRIAFGFSPVLMWTLFNSGLTSRGSFVIALLVAAFVGLVNGWFVTQLKIPSFLVTLGMLLVVRGTALFVTDGFPQRTWSAEGSWLAEALVGDFYIGPFRIYMSLFWFIAAAIALGYVLTQSRTGNWIQAAGGNPGAARARGVNVNGVKIGLFILSSIMASLARRHRSLHSAANPNSTTYELEVIAMVVIGGTADRRPRHDHRNRARHPHPARHAQRHRADRRARPCLQHLHRRHHPGHDGAALVAGTPASGRDLRQWPNRLIRMENIASPTAACWRWMTPRSMSTRARSSAARRQWRRQVDADQGAVGRVPLTSGDIFMRQEGAPAQHQRRHRPRHRDDHQDSALVTQLSIARNLFLGREPSRGRAS
jgi:branched-subunit amino acid ABC-type transport system permease component